MASISKECIQCIYVYYIYTRCSAGTYNVKSAERNIPQTKVLAGNHNKYNLAKIKFGNVKF